MLSAIVDLLKLEQRSAMKFLTKEGNDRMSVVYGEHMPSYYQVKFWSKQFKWGAAGRDSVDDDPRSGRPSDVITDEMCQVVEAFVLADRRVKVSTIAYEMSVSEGSVIRILHDKLGMSKVSCRWVPRMLSPLQKQSRVEICRENLSLYKENMETLCSHIVTETKHGFITGIPAQSRSQCNGSTRRRRRLSNFVSDRLPARLWRQCFGTATDFYLLNIWHTSLL